MKCRIFNTFLVPTLALFSIPGLALAGNHLSDSIMRIKEAIEHGKVGHTDILVMDTKHSLKDAEAADKEMTNPHIKEAINHLKAAIEEGDKQDAKAATGHAEEALTHLEAAAK
jgi:hypothetical protein